MTPVSETLTSTPIQDAVYHQLSEFWQDILGISSVAPEDNYFDLGGDSSLAVQLFVRIEKTFQVRLPLATLYEAPTLGELARIVRAEPQSAGWSSLVPIQPSGTRTPLFCFHGAGGNVLIYERVAHYLGPDQPVYGLQSQGLDGKSPCLTTIEEMAALYLREIRRVRPRGPYLLAGYCMGGTVAYEVAQQLTASGETVAMLALLDTMNWHRVPLNFWSKSSHSSQQLLFHIANFFSLDFSGKRRFTSEKLDVLRSRIPIWKGMLLARFKKTADGSAAGPVTLGRIWQMNDRASWKYIPKPYSGEILDFRPRKQYRVFSKPGLKWDTLAAGGQRTQILSVYPAGMLVEPFVKQLAEALRTSMDRAVEAVRNRNT
jgi:phthiocerol/phenolphthiocerol synthesis type-I polyketide synthase E